MHLPILEATADALFRASVAHVLQSSVFGLAVLGIILACRRASADLRRTLGWVGLLKFAVPAAAFAPLVLQLGKLVGHLFQGSPTAFIDRVPGYRLLAMGDSTRVTFPEGLVCGSLSVWALVTSVFLIHWATKAFAFRREVIAGAKALSERLTQGLAKSAAMVGLDANSVVAVASESEGPGILGFTSPLLVIPRVLEANLTPAELESILVHELVHLKRRDHLWGTIRTCFLSVFWFNPVVWLLCRSIALETEQACDEEVIRLTGTPRAYADGIVKTVRHSLGLLDPSLTGAARHSISRRVSAILNPQPRIDSPIMKTTALTAACLLAVLSVYAGASSDTPATAADKSAAGDAYDISKLDVRPKVVSQSRPVYPAELHAKGISGEVLVDFIVDTNGDVRNAFAAHSSQREFEANAVQAVSKWKFAPGQVAGHDVCTHMQVPIVFTVSADGPSPKS
jgi:TonB family protein